MLIRGKMKKIICKLCNNIWIVETEDLVKQQVCPYCRSSLQGKVEFDTCNSLDKAIYVVVANMGAGVLQNISQLSGVLMDTAPNLKKEIRIFSKSVTSDYLPYIRTLFNQELDVSEVTLRKLRHLFIEEEGLSETWADLICNGLHGALLYYKGEKGARLINVEVEDFEPNPPKTETLITLSPKHSGSVETKQIVKPSPKLINKTSRLDLSPSNNQLAVDRDPGGLCELAFKYYNGTEGYAKDERKALALLKESANYYNHIPAYNYLGHIFMKRREFDSASKWFQKSAAANNVEGLCMTGHFYQKGYGGVRQSTSTAIGCYACAASTGNLEQMVEIAKKFLEGCDVPQDEKIAFDILDAASKSGSSDAQFYLAKCYENGIGVHADIEEAIALYKTASENGNQEAAKELEILQSVFSFLKDQIKE